jgi:hypothetical protein
LRRLEEALNNTLIPGACARDIDPRSSATRSTLQALDSPLDYECSRMDCDVAVVPD